MNEDINSELFLFLMAKLEEYVIRGVSDDFYDNVISEKEGRLVLRLARLRTEVPGLFNRYLPPPEEEEDNMGKMCLLVEADKNLPKEVLEAAFKQYKSTVGLTMAKDGKLTVRRKQGEGDSDKTFAAMEKHVDAPFCIQVENIKKVIDEQPFTIFGSEDDPAIVAFLGGADFSSFEKPKEIHSGEYQLAMNKISPLIAKIMTLNDGDMDALASDLTPDDKGEGGDMGPKVKALLPAGAYLLLMTNMGHLIAWDAGENEHVFEDWGAVYGNLSEPVSNGQKANNDNKTDFLGDDSITVKSVAAMLAKDYEGHPLAVFEDGPVRIEGKDGKPRVIWEHAPKGNKDKVQAWYKEHCLGKVPKNWGLCPLVPAARQDTVKVADLKSSTAAAALAVKDTASHHIPVEPSMIMSADRVKDVKGTLLVKILGGVNATNPDTIYAIESQVKSTAVQLDDPRLDNDLPFIARYHCAVESPDLTAMLWGDCQIKKRMALGQLKIAEDRIKALEEEAATKSAATPLVAAKTGTDDLL